MVSIGTETLGPDARMAYNSEIVRRLAHAAGLERMRKFLHELCCLLLAGAVAVAPFSSVIGLANLGCPRGCGKP